MTVADWALVNGRVLGVFGPVLIVTGIGGFLIPPRFALLSGAPAYNIFHIAAGIVGTALVLAGRPAGIAAFNLGFGLVDLWQLVAGVTGLFPARQFRYKTADHIAHAVLAVVLVGVGWMGVR